jgi:hypothetical protein
MDMFRTNTFHLPLAEALVKGGKHHVHTPKCILRETFSFVAIRTDRGKVVSEIVTLVDIQQTCMFPNKQILYRHFIHVLR